MVSYVLSPHADYLPLAVRGIEVDLDGADVRYRVIGAERVAWPPAAAASRKDGLWRTTCFELFLMFDDGERYVEFNFSPSTQWAAYAFDGYREGMAELHCPAPPRVERRPDGVAVRCDLSDLPRGEHRMALTAVIEEEGGVRSFWSLAHPHGPPDFHAAACFVARLPAPGRS